MSSMCLMCWRHVITSLSSSFDDLYLGWPPMKVYEDGHMDLEFAPFLLTDSITIDSLAYDRLTNEPPTGADRAISSLKTLKGEGILKLVDYEKGLNSQRENAVRQIEAKLNHAEDFNASVLNSIQMWDDIGNTYANIIGRSDDMRAQLPVGILAAVTKDGSSITPNKIALIRGVISKRPDERTEDERGLFREVVRPYMDHIHTGIALYRSQKVPIVDWPDMVPIYKDVFNLNLESDDTMDRTVPAIRKLFSIGFDHFEPSDVRQFIDIIRDNKGMSDFRRHIAGVSINAEEFDKKYAQKLLQSVAGGGLKASYHATNIAAYAAAVGVLELSLGDIGTAASAAVAIGVPVAAEAMSEFVSARANKEHSWFLCLSRAKSRAELRAKKRKGLLSRFFRRT